MSIYTDLLEAAHNGKKFKVNLVDKSLWIDRKQVIKQRVIVSNKEKDEELIGEFDLEDFIGGGELVRLDKEPWEVVKFLYYEFKHSVPKEKATKKSYFKALIADELTDEELAYNIDRFLGQAMLEGYILLASMQGWLKWEYGDRWFWQCDEDLELIVLCDWIKQKGE